MTAKTLTGLELAAALCENVYGRADADFPVSIKTDLVLDNKNPFADAKKLDKPFGDSSISIISL